MPVQRAGGERECVEQQETCESLSTVAASAGGPARSSEEVPVIGVERRGRLICRSVRAINRALSGRKRVGMSKPRNKPFSIPKQLVWEAYERVRANKGAAGVDGQSLVDFESDLTRIRELALG